MQCNLWYLISYWFFFILNRQVFGLDRFFDYIWSVASSLPCILQFGLQRISGFCFDIFHLKVWIYNLFLYGFITFDCQICSFFFFINQRGRVIQCVLFLDIFCESMYYNIRMVMNKPLSKMINLKKNVRMSAINLRFDSKYSWKLF
jgi:hypothetical protein